MSAPRTKKASKLVYVTAPIADTNRPRRGDTKRLYNSVAECVAAWSGLETALATLLFAVIRSPRGMMAHAIYYAPSSIETRLVILDQAMGHIGKSEDHGRVQALWQKLLVKINRLKETRNKIVHGHISTWKIKGKTHARLCPPIMDFRKKTMADVSAKLRARQLPGLSAHDVFNHAAAVGGVAVLCVALAGALAGINEGKPIEGWHEELFRLEAGLNSSAPRKASQTRTKP